MSQRIPIIREASVAVLRAPLVMPFSIATGQHDELENVFLKVGLSSGARGFGEAAVATHITGETISKTQANLRKAAQIIEGRELYDPVALCSEVAPLFKDNHAALAAFEMAILDAWARHWKVPFWRLFGRHAGKFSTDITIVTGTADAARNFTVDFYRRGFRIFKIKVGRNVDQDFARVQAVVKAAPQARIVLDANQAYDARGMLAFLNELKKIGVRPFMLEQPVPRGDWAGLAKLTRESGVCVCADESVKSLADLKRALKAKAVGAVNIKCMKSGILEGLLIAQEARRNGLKIMMGAMMESALAITASAHFVVGIGGVDVADLDTTFFVRGPLARSSCLDAHGHFDLRKSGPGIGVVVTLKKKG